MPAEPDILVLKIADSTVLHAYSSNPSQQLNLALVFDQYPYYSLSKTVHLESTTVCATNMDRNIHAIKANLMSRGIIIQNYSSSKDISCFSERNRADTCISTTSNVPDMDGCSPDRSFV